jgi:bifunctional pyridoxal-dependent enzyme with beta-cystathionase and maltose regulon repressor activities
MDEISPEALRSLGGLKWTEYDPDPAAFLLDEAKVAPTPGLPFGEGGQGHARLNFATAAPVIDEIMERIGHALRKAMVG